ncbi:WbuC family cupin fold metalloprotein [Enterobacter sp. SES19]|uniref:WbuC family cupin fold metalloprotein n=1 Tax=Enterobacter TaxID=547 RepID=UPI0012F6DF61|nr:WbuC family cupin fold metalloprotein [Enterobacter sp. SES19]QGW87129.1 cupin fold metalloprotein, WbuC family [Enterobacter asburiae]QIR22871.1 WbuC family cupin fold metalloprotein [Enterobacter sp. SES19]
MKQITFSDLQQQSEQAANSPRLRAHRNLHPELSDPVQRLAIAMEPGTYVRPHRHPHTFELLTALSGRFLVLNFDDSGNVTQRVVLGEDCKVLEMDAGTWHAVLSLDKGGVIFEVKHGGYQPVPEHDTASWSPAENAPGSAELMKWYAQAQVGDGGFSL